VLTVSGSAREKRVPRPGSEWTDTSPPAASTSARTRSSPTPRPASAVRDRAVLSPGAKISAAASASSPGTESPARPASSRMAVSGSPWPSSSAVTCTWLAATRALSRTTPRAGFPAWRRSRGVRIPCTTAFRASWRSGARKASIRRRSISSSPPSISSTTSFF
jgi:hypothetical protein